MEKKWKNELDMLIGRMALLETQGEVPEIRRMATEGLDEWVAVRRRRDRARLAAATVCAAVVACVTLTAFAPRPDPEAIDAASQPDRAAVCVLADNMLTRL